MTQQQTSPRLVTPADISREIIHFLDILFTEDQTAEGLLRALDHLKATTQAMAPGTARDLSVACSELFERMGLYEQGVFDKLRARADIERIDAERALMREREEGSAESIEWFDPLPADQADALLVLDEKTGKGLTSLLAQIRRAPDFIVQGIRAPTRLRWVGPPGVGKTTAGHWLASHLGLPLALVRVDGLVSAYLGKTGKNIRAAFDAAREKRAVIFLDEIDAIGGKREGGGPGAGDEMRRVTTALLQVLNTYPLELVVICATNLPSLLDGALSSRLPIELRFAFPDAVARREIIQRLWARLDPRPLEEGLVRLVQVTEGRSGRDIADLAHAAGRHSIIDGVPLGPRQVELARLEIPEAKPGPKVDLAH